MVSVECVADLAGYISEVNLCTAWTNNSYFCLCLSVYMSLSLPVCVCKFSSFVEEVRCKGAHSPLDGCWESVGENTGQMLRFWKNCNRKEDFWQKCKAGNWNILDTLHERVAWPTSSWMDVSTAREPEVDLRDVGQKTLRNGWITQLQTVLGLRKTEELGGDWWSRLWSPTFRFKNEKGQRQDAVEYRVAVIHPADWRRMPNEG